MYTNSFISVFLIGLIDFFQNIVQYQKHHGNCNKLSVVKMSLSCSWNATIYFTYRSLTMETELTCFHGSQLH